MYAEIQEGPRAKDGRAPDVFKEGGWLPMRQHDDRDEVDFAIVGTGAGGATLAARLAEKGFSVVAFEAGPFFRPLEDFASDETEQEKLYWTDKRLCDGRNPLKMGANNSGKAVGGSTVHFAMVSLRFRPEWFKARSKLGYGFDWPLDWREMWGYYAQAEQALKISGPMTYPWGPKRGRYPYRAHELNAAAQVLAKGCESMGIGWAPCPVATVSAPRDASPPCVYRGFCRIGCSTNAKQSALVVWVPRAIAAGAEIRDQAMVGRIEVDAKGLATGLHYHREGDWHFQKAKHVIVAGYAIETPRLLLNSADGRYKDGLANSSGLVGKYLMTQSNQGVWGKMADEVRWNKGPPSLSITEHWNYDDRKDFAGGYCIMPQGPLPIEWVGVQAGSRGLWGEALRLKMLDYNHQVGVKMVGEMQPDIDNTVTLTDELDQYGLRVPRITYGWTDNDKASIEHGMSQMEAMMAGAGATDLFRQADDTNHLYGTAKMGFSREDSVVDADCRSWDHRNLFICDGSVFPTTGGVNPHLTIHAIALRTADRIEAMAKRGEL